MTKTRESALSESTGKKSKPKKETTIVDIWRRSGKSSAKNETDVLLESIIEKIGLN
jgi:hypothetical protein